MKPAHYLHACLVGCGLALAVGLTGCESGGTPEVQGRNTFQNYCAPCHGDDGVGNEEIGAPAIAGLDAWYVKAQLTKFRGGVRGAHFDDIAGMRMRPMSRALNEDQLGPVSAHVSTLVAHPVPTLDGDPAAGSALYASCVACHGADGSGNEALGAPKLTGASDWYLLRQLHNFKDGIRGSNPKDSTGATMRPMAMTLPDDQAMKNVIAHIQTLRNQPPGS